MKKPKVKRTPKYREVLELKEPEDNFITFKEVKLTPKQKIVYDLIVNNKIISITGVQGTSKTFIAAYAALKLFNSDPNVNKVMIVKPTEIVGSTALGYTPGTVEEKLAVYLENFNDVFEDIVDERTITQMVSAKELQFKAAQFVRGRTIKNTILIIDEFQNFELNTLVAILTRLGKHSKIILCGDIKQNDIAKQYVAVNVIKELLTDHPGIVQFEFDKSDNMRDPLVIRLVDKLEKMEAEGKLTPNRKGA